MPFGGNEGLRIFGVDRVTHKALPGCHAAKVRSDVEVLVWYLFSGKFDFSGREIPMLICRMIRRSQI